MSSFIGDHSSIEIEKGEERTSVKNLTNDALLDFMALMKKVRLDPPEEKADEVEPLDDYYRGKNLR